MICIEDFCGRTGDGFNTNFWADYDPDKGIVRFGGAWGDVPDMPCTSQPTANDVHFWAEAHSDEKPEEKL